MQFAIMFRYVQIVLYVKYEVCLGFNDVIYAIHNNSLCIMFLRVFIILMCGREPDFSENHQFFLKNRLLHLEADDWLKLPCI